MKSIIRLLLVSFFVCGLIAAPIPGPPKLVSEWPGFTSGPAVALVKSGDNLYAALQNSGVAVFRILPGSALRLIGRLDLPTTCTDLAVVGDIGFLAMGLDGLGIVDFADRSNPRLISTLKTLGTALKVEISNQTAFVAGRTGGLQIIDVSNVASPRVVGSYRGASIVWNVSVKGSLAYVSAGSNGLDILDVSDPANPTLIGQSKVRGRAVLNAAINGSTAYLALQNQQMIALDVHDPAAMTTVGTLPFTNVVSLHVQDSKLYVASSPTSSFVVLDAANPTNLVELGRMNGITVAGRMQMDSGVAWLPTGDSGITAVDISEPATITLKSSTPTTGEASDVAVVGDIAYVADGLAGLKVLDIRDVSNIKLLAEFITNSAVSAVQTTNGIAGLLTADSRALFLNVKDPAKPQFITETTPPQAMSYFPGAMALVDTRVYFAARGMWMANLENLPNLTWKNVLPPVVDFYDLIRLGTRLYAASVDAIWIFDIADPDNPRLVSKHLPPREGRTWGYRSLSIVGNVAFTGTDTFGLEAIDVRDGTYPYSLGNSLLYYGFGPIVGFGDWGFGSVSGTWSMLDLRNPSSVQIALSITNNPYSFKIVGNTGYLARGARGLAIYEMPSIAPKIEQQPTGGSLLPGTNFTIMVSVSGSIPISFQWTKNGIPLTGATNSTLTFNPFKPSDVGGYSVSVSNTTGSVVSTTASLRERNTIRFERLDGIPIIPPKMEISGEYGFIPWGTILTGIEVYDISKPATPILVGVIGGGAKAIAFGKDYAFVADPAGMMTIDLSNGRYAGSIAIPGFTKDIVIVGSKAIVATGVDRAPQGFAVVDISNPKFPTLIGTWGGTYSPTKLASGGGDHFIAASQYEGVKVFDGQTATTQSGIYLTGGYVKTAALFHDYAIASIGDYISWGGPNDPSPPSLRVIDLSQPTRPASIGLIPTQSAPSNIKITDDLAYCTIDGVGLQVFSLAEPTRPELVGGFSNTNWQAHFITTIKGFVYIFDAVEGWVILKSQPSSPLSIQAQRGEDGHLLLSWPSGFGATLQTNPTLNPASWADTANSLEPDTFFSPTNSSLFYRLKLP